MAATFGNQRQFHRYGMNRYEMEFRGVFQERIVISARDVQAAVRRGLAGFQRPGRPANLRGEPLEKGEELWLIIRRLD
jgi:hypothetical protein